MSSSSPPDVQLYVNPPLLNLPSFDTESLACIALLSSHLSNPSTPPGSAYTRWTLHPTIDPSSLPVLSLPAVNHDDIWVSGFRNILTYLRQHTEILSSATNTDISARAAAQQQAYLTFLSHRGQPLLDLWIYSSSENYTTITRSALSNVYPWPLSWTSPSAIRETAKQRCKHLGFSGDIGSLSGSGTENGTGGVGAGINMQIPESLRRQLPGSRKSVKEIVIKEESVKFRLEGLCEAFLEPLDELLGDEDRFVQTAQEQVKGGQDKGLGALDCYALAVLAQILAHDMPQPWFRNVLEEKFPRLARWARKYTEICFDMRELPWTKEPLATVGVPVRQVIDMLAESMLVTTYKNVVRRSKSIDEDTNTGLTYKRKQDWVVRRQYIQRVIRDVFATMAGLSGLAGLMMYAGVLAVPAFRKAQTSRLGPGEAAQFFTGSS